MQFLLIVVISLVVLGAIAALFSIGGKDEPIVTKEGDCVNFGISAICCGCRKGLYLSALVRNRNHYRASFI